MDCNQARRYLESATGNASATAVEALVAHLEGCAACRQAHGDAAVDHLLRRQPTPAPRAGFADAVIARAVQRDRRWWTHGTVGAAAASVAAVAVLMTLWMATPSVTPGGPMDRTMAAVSHEAQTVRVLIDSIVARDGATITIELADNLELEGYPERRVIEWQTDLLAGKNLLALPVRVRDQAESHLYVTLRHAGEHHEMRVDVRPAGTSALETASTRA